ncbi:hypothetical protein LCGC14_0603330 [marine sediment metagenome]|uniref:Uncharacterized protein n=1 Tax=marine sediment metagenome TaxID=412755 RepID=A0A0F9UIH2_9ZZZZ
MFNYKTHIYNFYVNNKRYHIIYKNRPLVHIKSYLKLKKDFIILKYKKFLNTVKRLKNGLFLKVREIKERFIIKLLSLKYDIQIEELNIAGDVDFRQIGKELSIPESVLGLLTIEFKKLKVKI